MCFLQLAGNILAWVSTEIDLFSANTQKMFFVEKALATHSSQWVVEALRICKRFFDANAWTMIFGAITGKMSSGASTQKML